MKHYYVYNAPYLKFNEKNNELEMKHEHLLKPMTKWQFAKKVILTVLITYLVCSIFVALACLSVYENSSNITVSLLIYGLFFYALGASFCLMKLLDYDYYIQDGEEDLINKLFSEEIEELTLISTQETIKAAKWRAEHPIEEKCRLAMTKNPNYVADLIKYVKENNNV